MTHRRLLAAVPLTRAYLDEQRARLELLRQTEAKATAIKRLGYFGPTHLLDDEVRAVFSVAHANVAATGQAFGHIQPVFRAVGFSTFDGQFGEAARPWYADHVSRLLEGPIEPGVLVDTLQAWQRPIGTGAIGIVNAYYYVLYVEGDLKRREGIPNLERWRRHVDAPYSKVVGRLARRVDRHGGVTADEVASLCRMVRAFVGCANACVGQVLDTSLAAIGSPVNQIDPTFRDAWN